MVWVDATAHTAEMIELLIKRDWAFGKFVGDAMGAEFTIPYDHATVSFLVAASYPNMTPALSDRNAVSRQSLLNRDRRFIDPATPFATFHYSPVHDATSISIRGDTLLIGCRYQWQS